MRGTVQALLLTGFAATVAASPWEFGEAIPVTTTAPSTRVFHHLDGSGRRHIAVSEQGVAVVWEDDRDGTPRVYLAYKRQADRAFSIERQVSGEAEAYEPSLIALGGERFAVAWEEAGQVRTRLVQMDSEPPLGEVKTVSHGQGAQASLTNDGDQPVLVWSEREAGFGRIRARRLQTEGLELVPQPDCAVDLQAPTDEQLYPAATSVAGRLVVVWEDRRPKHTIIMAGVETQPGACDFTPPVRISEKPPGGGNLPYGAGHGVSRVAIDRAGTDQAFAAWADKRSFRNGYDIWGAHYLADQLGFGANQRVQDDFGGLAKQRHAAVAGLPDGTLVVAWDDEREGSADVMLSGYDGSDWSEDTPVPVAAGPGEQTSPSLVLDRQGNLHLVWVERDAIGGVTRLRYGFGQLAD